MKAWLLVDFCLEVGSDESRAENTANDGNVCWYDVRSTENIYPECGAQGGYIHPHGQPLPLKVVSSYGFVVQLAGCAVHFE